MVWIQEKEDQGHNYEGGKEKTLSPKERQSKE
jgi:hypothetical protein